MTTPVRFKTYVEILTQMFATMRSQQGEGVDLNEGSMVRSVLESCALQDADQYLQLSKILDLASIFLARGEDLDRKGLDYGSRYFVDLRRRRASQSISKVFVGDGTLAASSLFASDTAVGAVTFDCTAGEGTDFDATGGVVVERGTAREETVVFSRVADTFTIVDPPTGFANTHAVNATVAAVSTKSVTGAAVALGAGAATLKAGTEASWPGAGSVIFERSTTRRELLPFTLAGVTLTLTGVTAFAHAADTELHLSTNGSDRAIAASTVCNVPATAATRIIPFRTIAAGTLLDGDLTSGLIEVLSTRAGADTATGSGTITTWTTPPFATATVTNPFAATGGRDREDDDTYSTRMGKFIQSLPHGTANALETLVANRLDPESNKRVAFAQTVEPVLPGVSNLYITDGSSTFSFDSQRYTGRDVLIGVARLNDARATLSSAAPHNSVATPVTSITPRIFASGERGAADLVGANFLEDSAAAFTPSANIGQYLKTDDDQFYRITANTAIRFTVVALGATPSLGSYSAYHFGQSIGILTFTGQPADTQTVVIDGKTYTFQTVLTDVNGNVFIGATTQDSIDNLIAAITLGTGAGTTYASLMTIHATVTAATGAGTSMHAIAKLSGTAGDAITTTETVALASWGGAVLAGGSDPLVPGTDYDFSASTGDLELTVPLVANDGLVAADDGATATVGAYTYTQGLAAYAQKIVNGDPDDRQNFPGIKCTGSQVLLTLPTTVAPSFTIQVIGTSGTTDADLRSDVQVTTQTYVNSLGIGVAVVLSEISRRIKEMAGVYDVRVLSPSGNVSILDGQIARITADEVTVV